MASLIRSEVSTTRSFSNEIFQAKSVVRDLDPVNDLRFLRMRSNKTEILIAPGLLDAGSK